MNTSPGHFPRINTKYVRTAIVCALFTVAPGCVNHRSFTHGTGYNPAPVLIGTAQDPTTRKKLPLNHRGQIDMSSAEFEAIYLSSQTKIPSRNFLITQLMQASDSLVAAHMADIVARNTVTNTVLSISTSLAGGLASIFTPPSTKSALGASAAFLNSSRSAINENIYANQLSTAIIRAITATRLTLRKPIELGLRTTSVAEYPIEVALFDIQRYHESGSFLNGLTILTASLDKRAENKVEIKRRIADLEEQYGRSKGREQGLKDAQLTAAEGDTRAIAEKILELQKKLVDAPE